MKHFKVIYCCLLVCFAVLTSCDDDDIQLSYQHTVQVSLYSMHTHKDTVLTNVKIYGVGREDSLLYDVDKIGALFLNLNLKQNTTQFVFKTQTLQDELFFSYKQRLEPISGSAGIGVQLHIDSVGHTSVFIDSVSVVYPDIKYNESLENVQVFVY